MNALARMTADEVVRHLQLQPLTIEGGLFRELYRAAAPAATAAPRCCATIVYYLLRAGQRSALHRVTADEIGLFMAGQPAAQLLITPDDRCLELTLGPALEAGQVLHHVMPAGSWQTTMLAATDPAAWALFACVVAPGFEYADFTAGTDAALCGMYPQHAARLRAWCARAG